QANANLATAQANLGRQVGVDQPVRAVPDTAFPSLPDTTALRAQALDSSPQVQQAERSEEHTSELQSRFDLVCRLLLEKKKKPELNLQPLLHTAATAPLLTIYHYYTFEQLLDRYLPFLLHGTTLPSLSCSTLPLLCTHR